jgi:hypothetical protein
MNKKFNVEIEKYKDDETRVGHQLAVSIIKKNKSSNVVNRGKAKKLAKHRSESSDPFVRRSELHAELDAAVASIRKDMVTHEELYAFKTEILNVIRTEVLSAIKNISVVKE